MKNIKKIIPLFLLFILSNQVLWAQDCTINAGANHIICGTSTTLEGVVGGNYNVAATWTVVNVPSGAPNPVIANPNSLETAVTGLDKPGKYTFRITQPCGDREAVSDVTVTAPGDVSTFTAGTDINDVFATTGTVTLNGVIPEGYTGEWRAENIYNLKRFSRSDSENAEFGSKNSATTTFSLIEKEKHPVDPAYYVTLKITSIENPTCTHEKQIIVRFVPNPDVSFEIMTEMCFSDDSDPNVSATIVWSDDSPIFSALQFDEVAGDPNFGTEVTLEVSSQPVGGNIDVYRLGERLSLKGLTVPGEYKFTLKVANAIRTYTTPELTFNFKGYEYKRVSFLDPNHPEQIELYTYRGTGGEVRCDLLGTSTPVTIYFKIADDEPANRTFEIYNEGIIPPGGEPTLEVYGEGERNRSIKVTPPSGGWRAGTYVVAVNSTGDCGFRQDYFIHISAKNQQDLKVDDLTFCYPGEGVISGTIPLPTVYQEFVNPSYFQDFDARYNFKVISKPNGASEPVFQAANYRNWDQISTEISNLDKEGEYVIQIKLEPIGGNVADFLGKEFACTGASLEKEFSIFLKPSVGANAGSDQTYDYTSVLRLNGNDPGIGRTGNWTVVSKPTGADDPVIAEPSLYNTTVTGFEEGEYTFKWTVTTGNCTNEDTMQITVLEAPAVECISGCNDNAYLNTSNPNTIEYDNLISGFHSTIAKKQDGSYLIWGQGAKPNAYGEHLYEPTLITSENGFNYTGEILKATLGTAGRSNKGSDQYAIITTDGLYVWGGGDPFDGRKDVMVHHSVKDSQTFDKMTNVNIPNANEFGLPQGVNPTDVKMMFGSLGTLALVTCNGQAYVLSYRGNKNGDGTSDEEEQYNVWHSVKKNATTLLNNVVAVRGTASALVALTSTGEIYTWGSDTYLGEGSSKTNLLYATRMTLPAGVIPKMIGMTKASRGSDNRYNSYYLISTTGDLYSLGDNSQKQLGTFDDLERTTWVNVKSTDENTNMSNIAWISPNEHDGAGYAMITALTVDGKLWGWGMNNGNTFGVGGNMAINPRYMFGDLGQEDKILAIETGGHINTTFKDCDYKLGYIGHNSNGSYATYSSSLGTNSSAFKFDGVKLSNLCALPLPPVPEVQDLKMCPSEVVDLSDALLNIVPDNHMVEWYTSLTRIEANKVENSSSVGPGVYYVFYWNEAKEYCETLEGEKVTVSYLKRGDEGYGECHSLMISNPMIYQRTK